MSGTPSVQRMASVQGRFAAFLADVGWDGSVTGGVDPDLIEAFVVRGLPGRRPSTRGTYRSVLAHLVPEGGLPPGRGTPFPGSVATLAYTPDERAGLLSMAAAQQKESTRRSALCVLAATVGAGLSAGEVAGLSGAHVVSIGDEVVVVVGARRPRVVPVASAWAPVCSGLADEAGGDFLFHPGPADRTYKNFVNNFCRHLVSDPALPLLSAGRGRASFICDHLAGGTALSEILSITGIKEVESLARYARQVAGVTSSKADLRRRLAAESGR